MAKQPPAATLRDGTLKLTIWKNFDDKKKAFYTCELVRGYQDKNEQWQDTHSLSGAEPLRAANLFTSAYNIILQMKAQDKAEGGQEDAA